MKLFTFIFLSLISIHTTFAHDPMHQSDQNAAETGAIVTTDNKVVIPAA